MEKYKWDLTRIFKNNNEFKETIKEVNKLLDKIIKYQGKILDNDSSLLELLELDEKIELLRKRTSDDDLNQIFSLYSFGIPITIDLSDVSNEEKSTYCKETQSLNISDISFTFEVLN